VEKRRVFRKRLLTFREKRDIEIHDESRKREEILEWDD
jgi:hypothetical protein